MKAKNFLLHIHFPYNNNSKWENTSLKKKKSSERLQGSFRIQDSNSSDNATKNLIGPILKSKRTARAACTLK